MFAPKKYSHQKEALGMQSPKILSFSECKKSTSLYGASNYQHSGIDTQGRQCNFPKFRGFLSPWYPVYTKTLFASKGSFRDAEPKYIILGLVQKGYKPLRGFKLPAFRYRYTGTTMQFSEISRLPIAMVSCLHQNIIYIKRKL